MSTVPAVGRGHKAYNRTTQSGKLVHVQEKAGTHAHHDHHTRNLTAGAEVYYKRPDKDRYARRGHLIEEADGKWKIQARPDGTKARGDILHVSPEHIKTVEEFQAGRRPRGGTGRTETTSTHGRRISAEESNRRAATAADNFDIPEDKILTNPRFQNVMNAVIVNLATKNGIHRGDADSSSGITLSADNLEYNELVSDYMLASMNALRRELANVRGASDVDHQREVNDFRGYLEGENDNSRIFATITQEGKVAVKETLKQRAASPEEATDFSYRDNRRTGREMVSEDYDGPVNAGDEGDYFDISFDENDDAHLFGMDATYDPSGGDELEQRRYRDAMIDHYLGQLSPEEREVVERKYGVGNSLHPETNAQIATAMQQQNIAHPDEGKEWNRQTVTPVQGKAIRRLKNMNKVDRLKPFWRSMREHLDLIKSQGACREVCQGVLAMARGRRMTFVFTPSDIAKAGTGAFAKSYAHELMEMYPDGKWLKTDRNHVFLLSRQDSRSAKMAKSESTLQAISDLRKSMVRQRIRRLHRQQKQNIQKSIGGSSKKSSLLLVKKKNHCSDDLIKSHIKSYTRRDGTLVREHDDSRTRKHVDVMEHENAHDEDVSEGNKLKSGSDLLNHLKGKGWKHRTMPAVSKDDSKKAGSKDDLPAPPTIKGANPDNSALRSAQNTIHKMHDAVKDSNDPASALKAIGTSRANPYLKAVDDYRTALLEHFGHKVDHTKEHTMLTKEGHTIIVGDDHKVAFAGVDASKDHKAVETAHGRRKGKTVDTGRREAKFITGHTNTSYTGKMNRIDSHFALVEADDLTTSHDHAGHVNQAYPQEIQPRDRARIASRLQIQTMAQNIKPELLGISHLTSDGAPMVGPDGVVESGNGRTISLNLAYKNGMANHYKGWLREYAQHVGISQDDVDSMKNPVLVRVRDTEVNRPEFAREANTTNLMQSSPVETAFSDAERITDEMLTKYNPDEYGDLDLDDNAEFIQKFIDGMGRNEAASMMDRDGAPNRKLVERMQAAVFAKVYKSEVLTEMMAESSDSGIRNIISAMSASAAQYARIQKHSDLDVTTEILDAIDHVRTAKRNGSTIEEQLTQASFDMSGTQQSVDPVVAELSKTIHAFKGSRRKLSAFFKGLTNEANAEVDAREHDRQYGGTDLFGESREQKGKRQIVSEASSKTREQG